MHDVEGSAMTDQQPTDEERRVKSLRYMFTKVPFTIALGIVLEEASPDGVVVRMPYSDLIDNAGGTFHGGAVTTLVDNAGAAAVWAGHDYSKGTRASTVSLTVNFVGAGRTGDLVARARCVRRARELNFAEIAVESSDGRPVASAVLVYRIG
jgi:uncharacterized protein (TIGR00369 family)